MGEREGEDRWHWHNSYALEARTRHKDGEVAGEGEGEGEKEKEIGQANGSEKKRRRFHSFHHFKSLFPVLFVFAHQAILFSSLLHRLVLGIVVHCPGFHVRVR